MDVRRAFDFHCSSIHYGKAMGWPTLEPEDSITRNLRLCELLPIVNTSWVSLRRLPSWTEGTRKRCENVDVTAKRNHASKTMFHRQQKIEYSTYSPKLPYTKPPR